MEYIWFKDYSNLEIEKKKITEIELLEKYDKKNTLFVFAFDDTLFKKNGILNESPYRLFKNIKYGVKCLCTSRSFNFKNFKLLLKDLKSIDILKDLITNNKVNMKDLDMNSLIIDNIMMSGYLRKFQAISSYLILSLSREKYENLIFIDNNYKHVYDLMKNGISKINNVLAIHFNSPDLFLFQY